MSLFGPPDIEQLKRKRDTPKLIKAMGYEKDWKIRKAAVDALGEVSDARAVDPLIAVFKSESPSSVVGYAAAEALGRIGDARAVEPLVAALDSSSDSLRGAAAGALAKIGPPAMEPLVAALRSPNQNARKAAAGALKTLRWKGDRTDAAATYWIIIGECDKCAEIGAPAVAPLVGALGDPNAATRQSAAETLGKIGDAQAIESLGAKLEDREEAVRIAAVGAIGRIGGDRAVARLVAALGHRAEETRHAAVQALARIGATAVEPLIDALKDENAHVREGAVDALGEIADSRAVEPVSNTVVHDASYPVRQAAAAALARLGWEPDTTDAKVAYWSASDQWNKYVQIGAPAVDYLVAALKDPDDRVRRGACEALGQIGDVRAQEPLSNALVYDVFSSVRAAAADALSRLGWEPDQTQVGAAYWAAKGQWKKCIAVGPGALNPLLAILRDSDETVRVSAAKALGQIGNTDAVAPLLAALGDEVEAVRQAVGKALAAYSVDRRLVAALSGLAAKDYMDRIAAARALGSLKNSAAIGPLQKAYSEERDSAVRECICFAVWEMDPEWLPSIRGVEIVKESVAELSRRSRSGRREIGQRLHDAGGFRLMVLAHNRYTMQHGRSAGSQLEAEWDRVGDWRA